MAGIQIRREVKAIFCNYFGFNQTKVFWPVRFHADLRKLAFLKPGSIYVEFCTNDINI